MKGGLTRAATAKDTLARLGSGLLVLVVVLGLWWTRELVGSVRRDGAVVPALSPAPHHDKAELTFLLIGNDSRERIRGDAPDRFGPDEAVTGQRADVVMLVKLLASGGVRVLSLPRDLRVDIPGYGPGMLAWALTFGGSPLMVKTVRDLTGLPVHHYVELDFVGFERAVDALGGISLSLPRPARDVMTGLNVEAGTRDVDGRTALAYVRSRTYEENRDGEWVLAEDGDLGRIRRQHAVMREVLRRTLASSTLQRARQVQRLGPHVTVDDSLSLGQMTRLARRLAAAAPADVTMHVLPTQPAQDPSARVSPFPPFHLGAIAYRRPVQPAATLTLQAFLGEVRQ